MNNTNKPSSTHLPALDGIRGMAILLVMIHHIFEVFDKSNPVEKFIVHFSDIGWSGVDLFFCLSGFLITGILLDSKGEKKSLKRFYYRRSLRIFPLYYISLLVIFVIYPSFAEVDYAHSMEKQWWYWAYLVNVLISIPGEVHHVATHFWSLAVEEQFYLIWPFVVFSLNSRRLLICSIILIVLAPLIRWIFIEAQLDKSMPYVLTISRMDSLIFGALAAQIVRHTSYLKAFSRHSSYLLLAGACAFVAIVVIQGSFARQPLMLTAGLTTLAFFFACSILAVANNNYPLATKLLCNQVLIFFGKVSYAMYIFHGVIIATLASLLFTNDAGAQKIFGLSGLPKMVIFTLLVVAASSFAAWLSWQILEKHFLKLKNRY
ncbi:Peptidoglycan/LPS O-acetylase OafA/YrhL, contains acyltransferase and SGNH-hydrolase domains [Alteromonadaceae bacterium Bs31]|nr:Peptidoglycan/LPS O-acetylase OafA/YrhL, contains acyltransferase and SGNH-hydrolase domains [Alteromonadaceae bacterium Bs31]